MNREDQQPETRQGPDENFEPYEEARRVPLPFFWIAIALALWGTAMLYNDTSSVAIAFAERGERIESTASAAAESGAVLFEARCATCHQPNGAGIRNAVPPLDRSEFVLAGPELIVQILLHGIQGPINVGGQNFDGNMPNFSSVMSDEEIAHVATYVRGAWSNGATPVSPEFVARQRRRFSDRNEPWTGGAELADLTVIPGAAPQPAPSAHPLVPRDLRVEALVLQGRNDGSWACASCHGLKGEGALNVPRLAGLDERYILKQLRDYIGGNRKNEIMETVVRSLSGQEMQALASYYSRLSSPSTSTPSLGGSIARGEQLALSGDWSKNIPSCFSCHGSSGFGVGGEFPALAAQHPAYTASQLAAWAGGSRRNSPLGLMKGISDKLSDEDRLAIADYLATLPPVPRTAAKQAGD